jgi:hypothetical protein
MGTLIGTHHWFVHPSPAVPPKVSKLLLNLYNGSDSITEEH